MNRDDLFAIDCLKEVTWPFGYRHETEALVQDSAGRLLRLVTNTPDQPFACAHECLAGHLAGVLDLSVSPGETIRFSHQDSYAQPYRFDWRPFNEHLLTESQHAHETAASILGFDFWLGNSGRHVGTLVIEPARSPMAETPESSPPGHEAATPLIEVVLLRHQHCFIGLYDIDDETDAFDPIPPEVEQIALAHPLASHVGDQMDFDPFLTRLERLGDETLRDIIRRVPNSWLSPGQKGVAFDYLRRRGERLRGQINELRPFCPGWD